MDETIKALTPNQEAALRMPLGDALTLYDAVFDEEDFLEAAQVSHALSGLVTQLIGQGTSPDHIAVAILNQALKVTANALDMKSRRNIHVN